MTLPHSALLLLLATGCLSADPVQPEVQLDVPPAVPLAVPAEAQPEVPAAVPAVEPITGYPKDSRVEEPVGGRPISLVPVHRPELGPGPVVIEPLHDDGNPVVIGSCKSDDQLLHSETVRLGFRLLQVRRQFVAYPTKGEAGGLISCVKLTALKTSGIGSAEVRSGGPGQRYVDIEVTSDFDRSVAWEVDVYGAPSLCQVGSTLP